MLKRLRQRLADKNSAGERYSLQNRHIDSDVIDMRCVLEGMALAFNSTTKAVALASDIKTFKIPLYIGAEKKINFV